MYFDSVYCPGMLFELWECDMLIGQIMQLFRGRYHMVKDAVVPKPFHCKQKLHVIPYLKVSFRGKVIRTQESLVHYITFDGIYFYITHPMDNLCGYFIM